MSTAALPEITLGLETRVINRSVRIRPGHYALDDVWRKGAIVVDADDIVIDFQGATLSPGGDVPGRLDQLEGYGLVIRGRRNVTIRRAHIHGYRYNIFVQDGAAVHLEDCDCSYSRSHRIWDDGVPIDHWVVIRDVNDWRTYGAGLWLERVHAPRVTGCRACSGQIGLVLAHCDRSEVRGCDFSFNSGWGAALFAACDNVVAWNRMDFVNRPWAGSLGADAAGLALAGGSHRNLIVGNSLTHGGDGFFLTDANDGGLRSDIDRMLIAGASDDNIIAGNDGSYSPANAFEGTFSARNIYYRNRANRSGYGFWLGFATDSLVLDNEIANNVVAGVAAEQAAGTRVVGNRLSGNGEVGVRITATPGAARDRFPAVDLEIRHNEITDSPAAYDLTGAANFHVSDNTCRNVAAPDAPPGTRPADEPSALERFRTSADGARVAQLMQQRPADYRFYPETGGPLGWDWTSFDASVPHDFRNDLAAWRQPDPATLELWLADPSQTRLTAPPWTTVTHDPAEPRRITVSVPPATGAGELRALELTLQRGSRQQVLRGRLCNAVWSRAWYDWAPGGVPLAFDDAAAWARLLDGPPLARDTVRELGTRDATTPACVPARHYACVATTRLTCGAGPLRFAATFDDGLRFMIDGNVVYDNWRRNRPTLMDVTVELAAGTHELVVQYCYESRYAMLRWYWPARA
jgi:nitrous oxidase accessory protein NosD